MYSKGGTFSVKGKTWAAETQPPCISPTRRTEEQMMLSSSFSGGTPPPPIRLAVTFTCFDFLGNGNKVLVPSMGIWADRDADGFPQGVLHRGLSHQWATVCQPSEKLIGLSIYRILQTKAPGKIQARSLKKKTWEFFRSFFFLFLNSCFVISSHLSPK